jgi:hypothetical protein|tara:strand:- start:163 stop:345 length:183 start_codon:yes stop_codon:yes gene_type:complete
MKYKVNDLVGFKSKSVNTGKVIEYDSESGMYSVEFPSGRIIKCTEHYITDPKPVGEEDQW